MRMLMVVVSVVSMVGCGGPVLEAEMGGAWTGLLSVNAPDRALADPDTSLSVTVEGSQAVVRGLCPLDDGEIRVEGERNLASWSGSLACAPFQEGECPVTLAYGKVDLVYTEEFLFLDGAGVVTACATSTDVLVSFVGTRP